MEKNPDMPEYKIMCVIVNFGLGSKVTKIAKHSGVSGGVILLGTGTVKNRILEFLQLTDVRKEIVLMPAEKSIIEHALKNIDKELDLKKPNHGIAFSMPLPALLGAGKHDYLYNNNSGGNVMYHQIMVVVERGKAEFAMEAATGAGARGGTIIKARGSAIQDHSKLFHMDIEPEKEIVMILSEVANTEKIVTAIRDQLEIDKAGNGIIFCQNVDKAYGLA